MNRDLMAQMSQMQEKLQKAQAEIEGRVAEATAGGGVVSVSINGAYRVQSLKIAPEAIDPEDSGMLEDLVTAAVNEALGQVQAFHADQLGGLTGGLNLPGLGGPGSPGGAGAPGPKGPPPPLNRAARRGKR